MEDTELEVRRQNEMARRKDAELDEVNKRYQEQTAVVEAMQVDKDVLKIRFQERANLRESELKDMKKKNDELRKTLSALKYTNELLNFENTSLSKKKYQLQKKQNMGIHSGLIWHISIHIHQDT